VLYAEVSDSERMDEPEQEPKRTAAPCYLCKAPAPKGGWTVANVVGAGCTWPPSVCQACTERVSLGAAKIPQPVRAELQARLLARGVPPDLQVRVVLVACWHGAVRV
jgi:hypothetical protein